jgi:hypothetical protein
LFSLRSSLRQALQAAVAAAQAAGTDIWAVVAAVQQAAQALADASCASTEQDSQGRCMDIQRMLLRTPAQVISRSLPAARHLTHHRCRVRPLPASTPCSHPAPAPIVQATVTCSLSLQEQVRLSDSGAVTVLCDASIEEAGLAQGGAGTGGNDAAGGSAAEGQQSLAACKIAAVLAMLQVGGMRRF